MQGATEAMCSSTFHFLRWRSGTRVEESGEHSQAWILTKSSTRNWNQAKSDSFTSIRLLKSQNHSCVISKLSTSPTTYSMMPFLTHGETQLSLVHSSATATHSKPPTVSIGHYGDSAIETKSLLSGPIRLASTKAISKSVLRRSR